MSKYEIGKLGDDYVVSDEIHTPDSSRYWFADTYQELFDAGESQRHVVGMPSRHDLQPHRQTTGRETSRDRRCWVGGDVHA